MASLFEDLLRLVTAVEELLVEVNGADDGPPVGLSAVHVLPVLAFTGLSRARQPSPRVGRVRLTAVTQRPALLVGRPSVLAATEVAMVAEHLAREMPDAGSDTTAQRPRGGIVGVPIRAQPLPPDAAAEPPAETDGLIDTPDLAQQLATAATAPLVEWMGFLHPGQARLVRRTFAGPARVRGPAGTGKTVVMVHRAAWLGACAGTETALPVRDRPVASRSPDGGTTEGGRRRPVRTAPPRRTSS